VTRGRRWISVFILTILGLHVVPVARELTGARETLWPFLTWGMFRHSSGPPVRAIRLRLFAVTMDGDRLVEASDTGLDRFGFRRYYQWPIAGRDSAAVQDLAQRLSLRWRNPVQAIVVEETTYELAGDGFRTATVSRRIVTEPDQGRTMRPTTESHDE
jgi:hypothetical protein